MDTLATLRQKLLLTLKQQAAAPISIIILSTSKSRSDPNPSTRPR